MSARNLRAAPPPLLVIAIIGHGTVEVTRWQVLADGQVALASYGTWRGVNPFESGRELFEKIKSCASLMGGKPRCALVLDDAYGAAEILAVPGMDAHAQRLVVRHELEHRVRFSMTEDNWSFAPLGAEAPFVLGVAADPAVLHPLRAAAKGAALALTWVGLSSVAVLNAQLAARPADAGAILHQLSESGKVALPSEWGPGSAVVLAHAQPALPGTPPPQRLACAIGAALALLGSAWIPLNLHVPRKASAHNAPRAYLLALAAVWIAIGLVAGMLVQGSGGPWKSPSASTAPPAAAVARYRELVRKACAWEQMHGAGKRWLAVLEELESTMPEGVWLTSLEMRATSTALKQPGKFPGMKGAGPASRECLVLQGAFFALPESAQESAKLHAWRQALSKSGVFSVQEPETDADLRLKSELMSGTNVAVKSFRWELPLAALSGPGDMPEALEANELRRRVEILEKLLAVQKSPPAFSGWSALVEQLKDAGAQGVQMDASQPAPASAASGRSLHFATDSAGLRRCLGMLIEKNPGVFVQSLALKSAVPEPPAAAPSANVAVGSQRPQVLFAQEAVDVSCQLAGPQEAGK